MLWEVLYLDNTQITDAGLPHLIGLKDLYWLSLSNAKVTDTGAADFERTGKLWVVK